MKLVIAEKPSMAHSIAKVLGATSRGDGYMEGNGYIVSWCIGHLVQMSNPEAYDEKYKKWKLEDLPIIPENYLYVVNKFYKKQFGILKKLLNRKDVNEVINACDAGREGELIFRLVYDEIKVKKQLDIKRLWISSLEDKAIEEGFELLKSASHYDNLYASALARAKADWLIGMNLSRYYSCLHHESYSVGRVQTPTLAMIVERANTIHHFKKEKYYVLEVKGNQLTLRTAKINGLDEAKAIKNSVSDKLLVSEVTKDQKVITPNLPFDLTTLQRACNKYFGFSAKQTLDYAQALYEKKLISYPRTDSSFLNDDLKTSIKDFLHECEVVIDASNFERCFNDKKVSDHHAIIPTFSSLSVKVEELQDSLQKVYQIIKDHLIASCSKSFVTNTTKVIVKVNDVDFSASGQEIVEVGFNEILKKYGKSKVNANLLPLVNKGDEIPVEELKIIERYTSPPKLYTEDSLLKDMERAGNEVLDKGIEVERKGLGTSATRAGIIESLIAKKLVNRDKKHLIATDKGIQLVEIVADFLKSSTTTAHLEMELYDVAKGQKSEKEFLLTLHEEIKKIILGDAYE